MPFWTVTLPTRSGLEIDVRPATEADASALVDFFDRVTNEDRRFRFLAAADHVGPHQIEPLVKADHFRTESWVGINRASGEIVASAVLACDGPLDTGEIAVSICGNHRGKGIGWAMLDYVADQAAQRGCRRAIAIESRDNHAAIDLEREKGFRPEPCPADAGVVVLERTFR
jgi:acetyltransferase